MEALPNRLFRQYDQVQVCGCSQVAEFINPGHEVEEGPQTADEIHYKQYDGRTREETENKKHESYTVLSGWIYLMYTDVETFISDNNSVERQTEKMTIPIFPQMKPMKSFALCFG